MTNIPKPGDLVWSTNLHATRMIAGIILNVDQNLYFDVMWSTGAHDKNISPLWLPDHQYDYIKQRIGRYKAD